ncbi:hypothetical protein FSP39_005159 [Pinctada imbricata]|uniref:Mono(ADP-ribosyl)transferase n=1 Tax=Pinctada imbricata TaxID=66713 RepID=A0AA88XYI5_PINIB|nr:hypothetical protein FSP39_005159 [Pinctada imbricata]
MFSHHKDLEYQKASDMDYSMRETPTREEIRNTMEEDNKDVNKMILAAKNGRWHEVYQVIGTPENPKKDFLINSIPENRRWSILMQAVWWKNQRALATILRFPACDISTKAKEGFSEIGPDGGKTALEIAQCFGHKNLGNVLLTKKESDSDQELDTFQPHISGHYNEFLGLIRITLGSYKRAFYPSRADPSKSLITILNEIFIDMESSETRWKAVRDKICESVYTVCDMTHGRLKACTTREQFYEAIINAYTIEENFLYDILNTALRRQRREGYRPTAVDLAIGPYVVVYQTLLLFWSKITKESATTYRKMLVSQKDIDKYVVGTKFVWLSFVSSSVEYRKAIPFPTCAPSGDKTIIFTINNTTNSPWQPKNIEKYAQYMERERVYPAGAKFLITKRRTASNGDIHVTMNLLSE